MSTSRLAILKAISIETLGNHIYIIDPFPNGGFNRPLTNDYDILVVKYTREEWPMSFLSSPEYFEKYHYER